jgi:hypothetical protein
VLSDTLAALYGSFSIVCLLVGAMNHLRFPLTMAVWMAGLVLFEITTRPFPTVELVAAIVLAVVAGALWSRGSVVALRAARVVVWVNALGGLLWSMAFAPDMFAGAWLAGVCAFGLIYSLERVVLKKPGSPA